MKNKIHTGLRPRFSLSWNKPISCIIPTYNEEKTIVGVIKTCLRVPQIKEIIIVNDGSQDKTLKKLQPLKNKIKIINFPQNHGKGYAVAQGIKAAHYNYLIFLDADLINFQPHYLLSLFQPVLENQVDMTIAAPVSFYNPYYHSWPLSGQRCLKKSFLINSIKEIGKTGYGLETFLNEKMKGKKIAVIPWFSSKPLHLTKINKQKDWVKAYVKETFQVFRQTIINKQSSYRKKIEMKFIRSLASYFKVNYQRLKDYLLEDLEE